ncbi:unnamed protein product [Adineta steineri]|uniref:Uncharacterized protein n=1 Tax=Adineta steineri TaxID=433720 RepID=A0A815IUH1_9BILA|nr:unnamed protein product [Adineta steineri]
MANKRTLCFTCNKDKIAYSCEGCSKNFCSTENRQILNNKLHHITHEYNEFKQTINEQKQDPQKHSLIRQINLWEIKSVEIIQQKAQVCRKIVIESLRTCINDIEMKSKDLNEQIKQIEPKFNKWNQNAITVAAGNREGQQLNQLNRPVGIFIDKSKNIFITDCYNDRVIEWKCNAKIGQIIAGGNGKGDRMNQLYCPTDMIVDQQSDSIIIADWRGRRVIQWVNQNQQLLIDNIDCYGLATDKHGFLYVSDSEKDEVRRWEMGEYNNEGIIVAGGNGQGNQLNQLHAPRFIFVDVDQSVYISDSKNDRVMKWRKGAKEGTIVAGGNGRGENLNQFFEPRGLIVDDLGQIYVTDRENHRVMRWCEGKEEGEIVVGGNGGGNQSNQLNGPCGLSFDNEGNLYVPDYWNHRIQKFEVIL